MPQLLTRTELPAAFSYPPPFLRLVDVGLTGLEPWWILLGTPLREKQDGIRQRFPGRSLVVFARRQDTDDVACWDLDQGGIAVLRDFAVPGSEQGLRFADFGAWLHHAVDELLVYSD